MDVKGLVIGVGMIAAGAAMAIAVPVMDSRSLEERNAWGQPYTAEVVKKKSTSQRSGSGSNSTTTRTYLLNYTYVLDDKRYCHQTILEDANANPPEVCAETAPAKVNKPTYEAHWLGDPIDIRINPDDPANSRPVILPDHGQWRTWGGFLALCGALVIWASVRRKREREGGSER